ncbi:MAG: FkbM family methyltransferase [Candidatus Binatia bacterium]
MRKLLQIVALAVYRGAAASGVLDRRWARDGYERAYFLYKQLVEARDATRLRRWIRPGASVIDVGANIGFFTVELARWVSGGGKVLALEPDPLNYGRLERTLARVGVAARVEAIQAAAAEAPGEGFLELNPDNPADHKLGPSGVRVRFVTIDDLVRERSWPVVSLIKIDVQGAEPRVLEGARETLARFRPAIFIEIHDASLRHYGSSARALVEICLGLGYAFHEPARGGSSPALTVDQILDLEAQRGYVDVLLLPGTVIRT